MGYKFNFDNKFSIGAGVTYFYSSIYLKYPDNKEENSENVDDNKRRGYVSVNEEKMALFLYA